MSSDLTIRTATVEDADTLVAFNEAMARETEDKTLDAETVRAGVRAVFEEDRPGFYLVAVRAETIVGSCMITTEWSDWRNGVFWWIQSVYVRPEARRTGVYRSLHRAVRRQARATDGVCGLRLYVERGNEAARRTYEAMGMTETSYRMYERLL